MTDKEVANTHKVPRRQWKKWTVVGKHVFNKTFKFMIDNPDLFYHPETIRRARQLPDKEFRTTAWNAAWMAADVCSRGEKALIKGVE